MVYGEVKTTLEEEKIYKDIVITTVFRIFK